MAALEAAITRDDAGGARDAGLARLAAHDTVAFRIARGRDPGADDEFIGAGVARLSTRHTLYVWVLATEADARAQFERLKADDVTFEQFRAVAVYNPAVWFFARGAAWAWLAGDDGFTKSGSARREWDARNPVSMIDRLASARDLSGGRQPDGALCLAGTTDDPRTVAERLRRRARTRRLVARVSADGTLERIAIKLARGSGFRQLVIDAVGLDIDVPATPDEELTRQLIAISGEPEARRGDWTRVERRLLEMLAARGASGLNP